LTSRCVVNTNLSLSTCTVSAGSGAVYLPGALVRSSVSSAGGLYPLRRVSDVSLWKRAADNNEMTDKVSSVSNSRRWLGMRGCVLRYPCSLMRTERGARTTQAPALARPQVIGRIQSAYGDVITRKAKYETACTHLSLPSIAPRTSNIVKHSNLLQFHHGVRQHSTSSSVGFEAVWTWAGWSFWCVRIQSLKITRR